MLILLGVLAAIAPLAIDLYLPAFAAIGLDLKISVAQVQQTLAIFMLGFALSQLIYGPLSDRFGRKPLMLGGLAVFAVASVGCALASSGHLLLLWRLLQALGCGAVVVVVPAIVRDLYRDAEAAKAMSMVMLTMIAAPLIAPTLGGQLLKIGGWRLLFDLQAVAAFLLLVLALFKLPETHLGERRPFNLRSVLEGYWQVICHRQAMIYILGGSVAYAGLFVFIAASPFVYMSYCQVSIEWYGILFGANVAMMMVLNWLNSRVVVRFGVEHMLRIASGSLLLAGVVMLGVALWQGGLWPLFACVVWYVGTLGLVGANSASAAINCFPQMAGTVSAFMSGLRFFLAALGSAAVGWLNPQTPLPMAAAMAVCGVLAFGLLCLCSAVVPTSDSV
jgi:DHA1 family bicyclomycin/chloramphenicol resistance-like MFS transporter